MAKTFEQTVTLGSLFVSCLLRLRNHETLKIGEARFMHATRHPDVSSCLVYACDETSGCVFGCEFEPGSELALEQWERATRARPSTMVDSISSSPPERRAVPRASESIVLMWCMTCKGGIGGTFGAGRVARAQPRGDTA